VGAVKLMFGAELRRRWRSWLVLVILIAVVGGLVLAAVAAGRRTATAFPRFVAAHGYDVYIYNQKPVPGLSRLPEVSSVTTIYNPASGQPSCACITHAISQSNFYINELSPDALRRVVKLVAGQMPVESSPYDVLASFTLQQDYGVHIGSVIHAPLYALSQARALSSGANLTPSGPTVALHVVGIGAAEMEFPSGSTPEYDLFTTSAFARAVNHRVPHASVYLVRLRHGTSNLLRFAAAVGPLHLVYVSNQATDAAAVAASIHPQAVGWWVLAVLAALVGLAVIGQALGRQSIVESEEYPSLVALGLPRRHLVALGTARNLMLALVGAVGAVIVAFAVSPLTPIGEARLAEPSTGLAFDPLVLLLGALATVVVVLLLGIWPAVRASRIGVGSEQTSEVRPSIIVSRVAATGAPPSAVIGVRHALERGRGGASLPVGTALFGSALAVMALCATVVFANSLSHLTATPALYGSDYQLSLSATNGAPGNPTSWVASLEHDHSISAIMLTASNEVSIKGHDVLALAGKAVRGSMLLSKVDGRLPTSDDEMTLGVTTLHQVGAHVGSVLGVTVQTPTNGSRTAAFRVVGTAGHRLGLHHGWLLERSVPARTGREWVPTGIRRQSKLRRLGEGDVRSEGPSRYRPLCRPGQCEPADHPDLVGQLRRGGELPAHPWMSAGGIRCSNPPPPARGQRRPAPQGDGTAQGARLRERAGRRNRAVASHDGCPGGHRHRRSARYRCRASGLERLCHQPRSCARCRRTRVDDRHPGDSRARGRQHAGSHPGSDLDAQTLGRATLEDSVKAIYDVALGRAMEER
jgi:hypothetical protein